MGKVTSSAHNPINCRDAFPGDNHRILICSRNDLHVPLIEYQKGVYSGQDNKFSNLCCFSKGNLSEAAC